VLATPLTKQELARVQEQFPELAMVPLPPHALSPMVWQVSDPDGMGATPTHQAKTQAINTDIWESKGGSGEKGMLPVPFWDPSCKAKGPKEGMLRVEGQAVCKSCCEVKHAIHSAGSTALPSIAASKGLWNTTPEIMEAELYPAKHPFVRTKKETNNPRETPFTITTDGYPLYKGSYILSSVE